MEYNWIKLTDRKPPEEIKVMTKIDDEEGVRNETSLKRKGHLWFHSNMTMYVYYTPTHWAYL